MATQTLRSHNPVQFDLPNGTVRANALTFRSKESILVFRGKVAVQLGGPDRSTSAGVAQSAPAP